MQSLRRIPAGAQVRVLFLNRSYAASTSNTDALTLRLNAISRLNSRNFLRFDDRNLVRADFLCFQRRGLQTTVQNFKRKKLESSSTNFSKKLPEETLPKIFLSNLLSLKKSFKLEKFIIDKEFEGVDRKIFRESEMKKIKGIFRSAYFWYIVVYTILTACMYEMYCSWKTDSEFNSKAEKKYATYLSSESVPFENCIEKLLKSGKVTKIIHLMWLGKAVAVLKPGAIVDGVTINQSEAVLGDVTAGEEYVVLNFFSVPFFIHGQRQFFVRKVRRMEKQLGIAKSDEVPIEMEGVPDYSSREKLLDICLIGVFCLDMLATRKVRKARSMIRGKLRV